MSQNADSERKYRLQKLWRAITSGKQPLSKDNYSLFLEATCGMDDAAGSFLALQRSAKGLRVLQEAIRYDSSPGFLNGLGTKLLKCLYSADLVHINGGTFLGDIVIALVEPPFFWCKLIDAFKEEKLEEGAETYFSWLLLQLVSLPNDRSKSYRDLCSKDAVILEKLKGSNIAEVRSKAAKISHHLSSQGLLYNNEDESAGGRHDNDFIDYKEISIFPTPSELICEETPFYRNAQFLTDAKYQERREAIHLDNQFRLLREDMLYEIREAFQNAKKGKRGRGFSIKNLALHSVHYKFNGRNDRERRTKWGLALQCQDDPFPNIKPNQRAQNIAENNKILQHQSVACLFVDGAVVCFVTIDRDDNLLSKSPCVIVIQFQDERDVPRALTKIRLATDVQILQVDAPVYAYEPILRALQQKPDIPLSQEILLWDQNSCSVAADAALLHVARSIQSYSGEDLKPILQTTGSVKLDKAQKDSLLSCFERRVSLIQGPPGTGKSFIGALAAKLLIDRTEDTILVICFTNHALDQFIEDLIQIGITSSCIVRLGAKASPRTEMLSLQKLSRAVPLRRHHWEAINSLQKHADSLIDSLELHFASYLKNLLANHQKLMIHLEFSDAEFYEAFRITDVQSGLADDADMKRVDKKGKVIKWDYLLNRWMQFQDAGVFASDAFLENSASIWGMIREERQSKIKQWHDDMLSEVVEQFTQTASEYNKSQETVDFVFNSSTTEVLKSKRIIACTTTGAAKHRNAIATAQPNIVLVEEAGEILESHIITALAPSVKQLILIGDHKQLRPKVNNFNLTVEKGAGFDLNRSLFERLILQDYPNCSLQTQHRMRPEISTLVRNLAYPELVDAQSVKTRPNIIGLQDEVIFINHREWEEDFNEIQERRDPTQKSSKRNRFEVRFVLKIVKYLAQQGYGTDHIVILTPYLGQLRELREALKEDNDPILNDLDSWELVKAGLLTPAAAKISKKPIRLATIDNYQGEESDIVIISLTRSNNRGDIGFMVSAERLTVLLSRARNCLIMIGNAETFSASPKGGSMWKKLFISLKETGHIYDGLPVQCAKHGDRKNVINDPDNFDIVCPDGGCSAPCNSLLSCGVHNCPSNCHQLSDHSKLKCQVYEFATCSAGTHILRWKCCDGKPASCAKCNMERKKLEDKQKVDFDHQEDIARLEAKIAEQRTRIAKVQLSKDQSNAIAQKEADLAATRESAREAEGRMVPAAPKKTPVQGDHERSSSTKQFQTKQSPPQHSVQNGLPQSAPSSAAKKSVSLAAEEWRVRKSVHGEENKYIDEVMQMIGLEDVKTQLLKIKNKVDVAIRQNASLTNERFNITMLGNPGTGKTTVARLYGRFLASVHVIPGSKFIETTGSRLANDGVDSVKGQLKGLLEEGGGTFFIDEAYQLTSQHASMGGQVLDFLLAEMENNVGKVVFIFAGYHKEMEKFFEHNPGLQSRVPYSMIFKDYEDFELLELLSKYIDNAWQGRMKIDDAEGIRGLYGRIVTRRLGRNRGRPGFGNARDVANVFARIRERQSTRLSSLRRNGARPDDFLLVKEDLIGSAPAKVKQDSKAWEKLTSMIGLTDVKKAVDELFSLVEMNYKRELQELKPYAVPLNRAFLGSPGTGKTTVATYYGQILGELSLLSNGEVVVKNPADFIGNVLGASESQTKGILASTVGKVLVIDEAYMLYGNGQTADSYKTAVIDTIVAEVQSTPGEDRCVLLLGYKDQMEEMFQNVNPGLSRRFAIEDAFHFQDYNDDELLQALELKLKLQDLTATDSAKGVAIEVLSRARNRPNFGNIGEVENLLSKAKMNYQTRQNRLPIQQRSVNAPFEPADFDPDFDRAKNASSHLDRLFEDIVGCESTIEKLRNWQTQANNLKKRGKDPRSVIPTSFVFKGPPGTGKTTVARKMGQVYYDMGFLSKVEVVECSASDLVGQYVGHTGSKTRALFEKALGRVLFIDEAYRLSEGQFAKEAMDEMVGLLTNEKFKGKMLVILAGYDREMNELLATNTGLQSRFPEEIHFKSMAPHALLDVLKRKLDKEGIRVAELEEPQSVEYTEMERLVDACSQMPSWGNARDMETIAKKLIGKAYSSSSDFNDDRKGGLLTLPKGCVTECIRELLNTTKERASNLPTRVQQKATLPMKTLEPPILSRLPPATAARAEITTKSMPTILPQISKEKNSEARDAGVSDATWKQLQIDKKRAEQETQQAQSAQKKLQDKAGAVKRTEKSSERKMKKLESDEKAERDAAKKAELMKQREQERLRMLRARAEYATRMAALEAEKAKERERQAEESRVQQKIRELGVCVMGYRWIKQANGYRCAGGSHFLTNGQLGIQ